MKSANSFLDRFKLQINFEFKEREVGKNSLSLERIQNEHVSVIESQLSAQLSDCNKFGGVEKLIRN